jgi:hypothetical protein
MIDTKAPFALQGHNPDVLTCIANLSNDEVFTPPEFANQMLDMLTEAWAESNDGASIWANRAVTFLDPVTKSGVFLREITRRLIEGLAEEIPDLAERVDHVLTKQVYGIGITELTALLARRSLYCSKFANGKHSVARSFDSQDGNIWFERTEHTWANERCKFCGANQGEYERGADLETHAYAFIHTDNIKARIAELFGQDMKFDVIIGNPPYQLDDGGHNNSATPIYQHFVERAFDLDPRYVVFVTPSRWFAGGRGLDGYRERMLGDHRIRNIGCPPGYCVKYPEGRGRAPMGRTDWDAEAERWAEQIEAVVGGMRAWRAAHPRATFRQIAEAVDAELGPLRARMLAEVAAAGPAARLSEQPREGRPRCARCGGELVGRGRRRREVTTRGGVPVALEREYGVCASCKRGVFPPG